MPPLSLLLILACLGVATGFQSRNSVRFGMVSSQVRSLPRHPLQLNPSDLDATQLMIANLEPLRDYVNFWAELFKPLNLPEPLVHWGHGAAMTTVLVAMGGIGTFLGWKIRQGDGAAQYAFTLGKTAREQVSVSYLLTQSFVLTLCIFQASFDHGTDGVLFSIGWTRRACASDG